MTNPIPFTGLFAAPDSLQELMEYCERFYGQERAIAMMVATITMNVCHKLVENENAVHND